MSTFDDFNADLQAEDIYTYDECEDIPFEPDQEPLDCDWDDYAEHFDSIEPGYCPECGREEVACTCVY